jgi:hypothetical protein
MSAQSAAARWAAHTAKVDPTVKVITAHAANCACALCHSEGEGAWKGHYARICTNRVPEAHLLGEFPMDCHPCHLHVDA